MAGSPQLPPSPALRPSVSVEGPNPGSGVFPDEITDISEDDFEPESGPGIAQCEPPLRKVSRGRPTKKRKRKGDRYTPTWNETSPHS